MINLNLMLLKLIENIEILYKIIYTFYSLVLYKHVKSISIFVFEKFTKFQFNKLY